MLACFKHAILTTCFKRFEWIVDHWRSIVDRYAWLTFSLSPVSALPAFHAFARPSPRTSIIVICYHPRSNIHFSGLDAGGEVRYPMRSHFCGYFY